MLYQRVPSLRLSSTRVGRSRTHSNSPRRTTASAPRVSSPHTPTTLTSKESATSETVPQPDGDGLGVTLSAMPTTTSAPFPGATRFNENFRKLVAGIAPAVRDKSPDPE